MERTEDILGTIGPRKTHQFLCGFSMETRDLVENSSAKLAKKNLDMVVANNLKVAGAGFGVDTNVVTFITPDGTRELPLMSKADVADAILDEILRRRAKSNTAGILLYTYHKIHKRFMVLSENSALPVYFMLQNYIIRVCPHIWKESVCAAAVNIWRRALLCSCTRIIASICWTM